MLPWLLCAVPAAVCLALFVKIRLLQRSMDEIRRQFGERLGQDTNNLIYLPSRDRHARKLAGAISEQLRLLQKQRRQYENGDRELHEAVTNISHDLRTPLTAICGYLDLLEREEKSAEAERYLGFIRNRADALCRLTEELFRYSVLASVQDGAKREPVCLNRALEDSLLSYYAALSEKGICPEISLPETEVMRELDPDALGRVFGNILHNAVKYSGGDLLVSLSPDGVIAFSNSAPDLTPVAVARMFDRFYTVETGRNSTGLGLAIAKLLTARMGGEISAAVNSGVLTIELRF